MKTKEKPTTAFVLALIGGILIFLAAPSGVAYHSYFWSPPPELVLAGRICGIVVIISAIMLYVYPKLKIIWGVIIIVFSLISLVRTGGFFLGMMLGIVGGASGIVWKPVKQESTPNTVIKN